MTTQELPRKTLTAVLEAQGEQMKGNTQAFVYQIRRKGMNYPDFITWWPPKDGPADVSAAPRGTLGQTYQFVVETKPKGEGKKGEYYNLVNFLIAASAPAAAPKSPAVAPIAALAEHLAATKAEAPPWDESWSEERKAAVVQALARDITRTSIERQTALKAAVELAGYSIAQGQNMRSPEVLLVASKFEEWLRTGKLPPVVLQPKQPVAEAKGETT